VVYSPCSVVGYSYGMPKRPYFHQAWATGEIPSTTRKIS
jgi:hypothetical protein